MLQLPNHIAKKIKFGIASMQDLNLPRSSIILVFPKALENNTFLARGDTNMNHADYARRGKHDVNCPPKTERTKAGSRDNQKECFRLTTNPIGIQ